MNGSVDGPVTGRDVTTMDAEQLFQSLSIELGCLAVFRHVGYDATLVDELRRRFAFDGEEVFVLPASVSDCIRSHFGGGRRTFDALTRRIRFAYSVWQGKYGPWTPEQADYAEELILFSINKGIAVAPTPKSTRPMVYTWLDRIVHHENVDQGFKIRAGAMVPINLVLEPPVAA